MRQLPTARAVALDMIGAVLDRGQPLDEAFDRHPVVPLLSARDRAFARQLSATTLRRLGQIDALIDHALAHPLRARERTIRHILRLGLCQLAFLGTPAHAAVDTSVELCRQRRHASHVPLVNALLRRLAGEAADLVAGQDAPRLNTPAWLWQSWVEAYGEQRCRAIAEAHLHEAPLDLTRRNESDADLVARLEATVLPTGSLRLTTHGLVSELPGFAEGAWWVQDAAAALPVKLFGDVCGRRIVDLCSAPGGKTLQLAAAGAQVTAVDRSPTRLARVRDNLRRLGLDATTVVADAATWRCEVPFDDVLLDVPCSATGTIRRHPDILRCKVPTDVATLAVVQAKLLRHALTLLPPHGRLVYCACSLQPEEGPAVIADALAEVDGIEREPIYADEIGGLQDLLTTEGDLRSLPGHLAEMGGIDGFYAARLRRRSSPEV